MSGWQDHRKPLVICGHTACPILASHRRGDLYVCGDHKQHIDIIEARGGSVTLIKEKAS